ncbi:MAG TPA: twin-arginine translocase TatA/TatE family subunit [Solirubrobacteraceae bacterium]|jgi:sec-independent protein translocase protein TatA|nr:twin-arginine translocase TatA/TatE family subunit [Solirubrobacteraceae bacterium]
MGLDNPLHIAFLVVILLLVFGAKRLPEIGRSLGSGMREFKTSVTGEANHSQQALPPAGAQQQPAAPAQVPAQPPAAQAPAAQPPPAPPPVAEPVTTPAAPPEQPPAS